MTFGVHTHALEHLKLVPVALNFVHFRLVLLEEARKRINCLLGLGVSEVLSIICDGIKVKVVIFFVTSESALQVVAVPLNIVFFGQVLCSFSDVVVLTADVNERIGVDVLLEFWFHQVCNFLLVNFFWFFELSVFVVYWLGLLRGGRGNNENLLCSFVADWVAVKDVTSVLAVVLTKSPSKCLTHELR